MTEPRFDYAFAGGGLSTACLLLRLHARGLLRGRVLVVDPGHDVAHHTYAFWSERKTPLDDLVERSWARLRLVDEYDALELPLETHRYRMFHLGRLFAHARRELAFANVEWIRGHVGEIRSHDDEALLSVGDERFRAAYAFDARPPSLAAPEGATVALVQAFHGARVALDEPRFDPGAATLMDFRAHDDDETLSFAYVLPEDPRTALVDLVRIAPTPRRPPDLAAYLARTLGVRRYRVLHEEGGATLLTDAPFPRRLAPRVLAIGMAGGRLKPSSGYAVTRILEDSEAITTSLERHGHPFDLPARSPVYARLDRLLLEVMRDRPREVPGFLMALFARNAPDTVLRFLDEKLSTKEVFSLAAGLPRGPFIRALGRRLGG